jgi:hypothetical protein
LGKTNGVQTEGGVIKTVHQYWRHGQVFAYAISMAGCYAFKCAKKGDVPTHAPLDTNLNYVNWFYERGLHVNSLAWLKERDEYTRTLMVSYLRRGYSQGASLEQALIDTSFEWKDPRLFKDITKAISPGNPTAPGQGSGQGVGKGAGKGSEPRTPRRPRPRKPRPRTPTNRDGTPRARSRSRSRTPIRRQPNNPSNQQKTATLGPKGAKLCVSWGLGKCQKGNKCKDLHGYCSRRLIGGGVCGRNHPQFRCDNPKKIK